MNRLPTETKRLKGTDRPSREMGHIDPSTALTDVPEPPDTLSEGAVPEWNALTPLLVESGVLRAADLRALALCCETLAIVTDLETAIRKDGFTIPAGNGARKAHPALKALETQKNAAHRMLGDFGLNPKAAKYVTKAPAPSIEGDEFGTLN